MNICSQIFKVLAENRVSDPYLRPNDNDEPCPVSIYIQSNLSYQDTKAKGQPARKAWHIMTTHVIIINTPPCNEKPHVLLDALQKGWSDKTGLTVILFYGT